jgi:hypothetical protein
VSRGLVAALLAAVGLGYGIRELQHQFRKRPMYITAEGQP